MSRPARGAPLSTIRESDVGNLDAAVASDLLIERTLPARYVSGSPFVFTEADGAPPDVFAMMQSGDAAKSPELERGVIELMQHLGAHSRRFFESLGH